MNATRILTPAVVASLALATPSWAQCGSWTSVGEGQTSVFALRSYDDGSGPALYAGGWFADPGGGAPRYVARWDGSAWDYFGGAAIAHTAASTTGQGVVRELKVFDDGNGPALYAAGDFDLVNGAPANNLARWDGTSWSPVASVPPQGFGLFAMEVFDDGSGPALYVGGAAGYSSPGNSKPILYAHRLDRWDGASWSEAGAFPYYAGLPAAVQALTVFDDGSGPALYMGGSTGRIHKWGGNSPGWTLVNDPYGANPSWFLASAKHQALPRIHDLLAFDDGSGPALYVAGVFNGVGTANGTIEANHIVRFDGTHWSPLAGGVAGRVNNNPPSPIVAELFAHDDGSGPKLYVGGTFTTAGAVESKNVAAWDGTSWSALGSGVSKTVYTLPGHVSGFASHDDGSGNALYVGGYFIEASGSPVDGVARWRVLPGPASYCTVGTTSLGCTPTISAVGAASASHASGFEVTVAGLDGQSRGILVFGSNGAEATPWGSSSSFQCVRAPRQRTSVYKSIGAPGTCHGALQVDFNAWMTSNATSAPGVGQTVWMQGWFRDAGAAVGSSLSDGLMFPVCP